MKVSFIYLAGILFLVTGCGQDVQSVDYYKAHVDERKAKIKECRNNPGELKDDPNCVNALTAQSQDSKMPDLNRVADPLKYEKF